MFKHQIVCHFSGGQGGVSCFRTDAGYMGGAVLYWHLAPIYRKKSVFIHQLLISSHSQCCVWPGSLRKTLCSVWSAGCCVFQLVKILRYRIEKMTSLERGGGFLFLDLFQYFASPPLFYFALFCFFKPLFCGRWKRKRNILAHFRVNFQIVLSDCKETVYSAGKLIPEFNPCFNRHQNACLGLVFSAELEAKKHKSTSVFIAVIDNCVGREGKALSYYCSATRKSFERRRLFHVSPLQAHAHQSLPRLSPIWGVSSSCLNSYLSHLDVQKSLMTMFSNPRGLLSACKCANRVVHVTSFLSLALAVCEPGAVLRHSRGHRVGRGRGRHERHERGGDVADLERGFARAGGAQAPPERPACACQRGADARSQRPRVHRRERKPVQTVSISSRYFISSREKPSECFWWLQSSVCLTKECNIFQSELHIKVGWPERRTHMRGLDFIIWVFEARWASQLCCLWAGGLAGLEQPVLVWAPDSVLRSVKVWKQIVAFFFSI